MKQLSFLFGAGASAEVPERSPREESAPPSRIEASPEALEGEAPEDEALDGEALEEEDRALRGPDHPASLEELEELEGEEEELEDEREGRRLSAAGLARRLAFELGHPVEVSFTDNRRRMLSSRRRGERILVRVHRLFRDAEEPVLAALGLYLREGDGPAAARLQRYIESQKELIRDPSPRVFRLRTRGRIYDLKELFSEVSRSSFGGKVRDLAIGWSRAPSPGRSRRRSIRLGTYTPEDRLIRIHPALDQAFVPRYVIAFVVFHEMLHHVIPPRKRAGRMEFHPPEFLAREKAHPDYRRAVAWERENLDRLLRYRKPS